jgi:hypothetical protein
MSEEHLINRNVGIVLAIVCGILVVLLVQGILWGEEQRDIILLRKSVVWTDNENISEDAGSSFSYTINNKWWYMQGGWAYVGYATVQVLTSTSDKTYVEVSYWYNEVDYHCKKSIGNNGSLAFPVLPAGYIYIYIGNEEPVGKGIQNQTVTITYHY